MSEYGNNDDLIDQANRLFDALAQSQATTAEIKVQLEKLRFQLQARSGLSGDQRKKIKGFLRRVEAGEAVRQAKGKHEVAPEVIANLTWEPAQPTGGEPLKLRRVTEKSTFQLKATFGEILTAYWPKVSSQLTLEQRATVRPKMVFDRLALERGFDTRTLWRAWREFVLAEQAKSLTMPLPADWALCPPNADRFQALGIGADRAIVGWSARAALLTGIEASDADGREIEQVPGLTFEHLADDVDVLRQLLPVEDEVWMVCRLTGRSTVLALVTMVRDRAAWRVMWQVLHERERASAIEVARRLNHHPRQSAARRRPGQGQGPDYCRVSDPRCHVSGCPGGNCCHVSAREPLEAQAEPRVTARITAGRRVA